MRGWKGREGGLGYDGARWRRVEYVSLSLRGGERGEEER